MTGKGTLREVGPAKHRRKGEERVSGRANSLERAGDVGAQGMSRDQHVRSLVGWEEVRLGQTEWSGEQGPRKPGQYLS